MVGEDENTRVVVSAEYLYPGAFFPEETYRDLPEATLAAAVAAAPDESGYFRKDGWYAVRIRSTPERRFVDAGGSGAAVWVKDGETEVWSAIVGQEVHVDDPSIAGEEHSALRSNIRSNGKDGYGVLARSGNWQIASDWDAVITPEQAGAVVVGDVSEDAADPQFCPTCGAKGEDECASRTGRDHPTRRTWIAAYAAGRRAGRNEALDTVQRRIEVGDAQLTWHQDKAQVVRIVNESRPL